MDDMAEMMLRLMRDGARVSFNDARDQGVAKPVQAVGELVNRGVKIRGDYSRVRGLIWWIEQPKRVVKEEQKNLRKILHDALDAEHCALLWEIFRDGEWYTKRALAQMTPLSSTQIDEAIRGFRRSRRKYIVKTRQDKAIGNNTREYQIVREA